METIFMNTENSKTNEPFKFSLNLSQRLDLRSSNKHVALQNLSLYIKKYKKTVQPFACQGPITTSSLYLPRNHCTCIYSTSRTYIYILGCWKKITQHAEG